MKMTEENNKKRVLEAFDTLFNKRDYVAAERYWSPNSIQHRAIKLPGPDHPVTNRAESGAGHRVGSRPHESRR